MLSASCPAQHESGCNPGRAQLSILEHGSIRNMHFLQLRTLGVVPLRGIATSRYGGNGIELREYTAIIQPLQHSTAPSPADHLLPALPLP